MKQLFVMMLVWLTPIPARAESDLGLAIKAGPNTATFAENNHSTRYGFSGGLAGYLQRPLDQRFSLAGQVDLLYTPRGSETVFQGMSLAKTRSHYVDLVLAARPGVQLGRVNLYILLGGGLNFLLSASQVDASGGGEELTDALHRLDVALVAGAGIALRLPRGPARLGAVFLEGRHDHGLRDTDRINGGFKNRASSLMLGLSFTLTSPP